MLAFFSPSPIQFMIFAVVIMLLFSKRIPGVMRSLGRSIVEFKHGIKDDSENGDSNKDPDKNADA